LTGAKVAALITGGEWEVGVVGWWGGWPADEATDKVTMWCVQFT